MSSGTPSSPPRPEDTSFVVAPRDAGKRLDRIVADHLPSVGRRGARALFEAGLVRVNGRRVRKGTRATPGDRVDVEPFDDAPRADPSAELRVLHESPAVVVVSKPAGLPTVPLAATRGATLAGALLARFPECALVGHRRREPGVIHRLDTGTSGLVVCARTPAAFDRLSAALGRGEVQKRYLAVVEAAGLADQAVIAEPLRPDPRRRGRVEVVPVGSDPSARASRTSLRVVERGTRWALVELQASRAYRHQIRAHLAWLGHPIAGDATYGGPTADIGDRHALHASHVAFEGDDTVEAFRVDEALPPELAALLRS